ncbi:MULTISPECIES: MFS transporter [unclassified Actinobaculum]|uniref:MFS transporter n=1 Tax=unclassified Actinobaculum TaxID=2609299 RepID=UPI0013DD886A|nr:MULTISPECIES: MFS transporter [unclassified Actinobaculum]
MSPLFSNSPIRERLFRRYFLSQAVSWCGTSMAPIAVSFAAIDTGDSLGGLGLVLAARAVATLLFVVVGGVIADSRSKVKLLQVCCLTAGLTQCVAAWLLYTALATVYSLAVLEFINGAAAALMMPATQSIIPELVAMKRRNAANALLQQVRATLGVIGPVVAGVLVTAWGTPACLAVNGMCWLFAMMLLFGIKTDAVAALEPPVQALLEGWRYFIRVPWLRAVVASFTLLNALIALGTTTIGPWVIGEELSRSSWGFARSFQAIGLLAGSLIAARVFWSRPLYRSMIMCVCQALPFLVIGYAPTAAPLLYLAFFAAGTSIAFQSLAWKNVMQADIPQHLLSRVFAIDMLGSLVAVPVGQVLAAPLMNHLGLETTELMCFLLAAAGLFLCVLEPSLRRR